MESVSLGGRPVAGFSLGEVGVSATSGCVCMPPILVGAAAGTGMAAIAHQFGAPLWGTVVSGVGLAIGTWAALR
jgi:hypothetical protein